MYVVKDECGLKKQQLLAYVRKNDSDGFKQEFANILEQGCVNAEILSLGAAVYCQLGEIEKADKLCHMAIEYDASCKIAFIIAVKVLLYRGEFEKVIKKSEQYLNDDRLSLSEAEKEELENARQHAFQKLARPYISFEESIQRMCLENIAKMSIDDIYQIAVNAYNAGEGKRAYVYIQHLLPKHQARFYFLAGLILYRYQIAKESSETAIRYFEMVRQLNYDGLNVQDRLKCNQALRTLYWKMGDAARAYYYAIEASEAASDLPQKRFDFSSALFTANHLEALDASDIFSLHRLYETLLKDIKPLPTFEKQHKKIRIGYFSPDFRYHPVAFFIMGLIKQYDRQIFTVYCYSNSEKQDAVTADIRQSVDVWRDVHKLSAKEAARQIQADEIDILVELAGHTAGNGMDVLAYRPAPIQICGIGYISTTGLSCVDYFITDPFCTTTEQEKLFIEKPLYLEHTHFCYTPSSNAPLCSHEVCADERPIVFGCFNKAKKISDTSLRCWKEILSLVENSKLLLKAGEYDDDFGRKLMIEKLERAGIAMEQVILEGASEDYLERYNSVDIALDTYPCGGGTTTFEALYMGVPVITLVGERHVARFGYSILKNLGIDAWIAFSVEEYIEKAVALAKDRQQLDKWHQTLREKLQKSVLMDTKAYTSTIELQYLRIYYERVPLEERIQLFSQAVKFGNFFIKNEQYTEALQCAKIMLAIDGKNPAALLMAAGAYLNLGAIPESMKKLQMLLEDQPTHIEGLTILAHCYKKAQQYVTARNVLEKAFQIVKNEQFQHYKSGEICSLLGSVQSMLGNRSAMQYFMLSSEVEAEMNKKIQDYSNALFAAHYQDELTNEELYQLHCGYNKFFAAVQPYPLRFASHKRLRIAYVSADLHYHPVAYYALCMAEYHDTERFELYYYHAGRENDVITERFKQRADVWRDISALQDAEAAQLIYQDEIDVLIDLSGHTAHNRLGIFAYRPAALQISGIGYFHSTGLQMMDYLLSDSFCDPPEEQAVYFSERILYLPHTHWCYQPLAEMPSVGEAPCLKNGYITFGSFNNFSKTTDTMLKVWRDILLKLPQSRLILKSRLFSSAEGLAYTKVRLQRLEVPVERIEFRPANGNYLNEYNDIDICLDTFPYQGGATTCEALYMGVPVVVLIGKRHGSRFGKSILNNIGCSELLADTLEEYKSKAMLLAQDIYRIERYRKELRSKMEQSALMNPVQYMKNFEEAVLLAWKRKCIMENAAVGNLE